MRVAGRALMARNSHRRAGGAPPLVSRLEWLVRGEGDVIPRVAPVPRGGAGQKGGAVRRGMHEVMGVALGWGHEGAVSPTRHGEGLPCWSIAGQPIPVRGMGVSRLEGGWGS